MTLPPHSCVSYFKNYPQGENSSGNWQVFMVFISLPRFFLKVNIVEKLKSFSNFVEHVNFSPLG